MPGADPLSLEQRVARLERLVARLLEESGGRGADGGAAAAGVASEPQDSAAGPAGAGAGAAAPGGGPSGESRPWSWPEPERSRGAKAAGDAAASAGGLADHGERWLGRVGVAFVVLAFGFLFKYAFDQGWIGPALRLVLGLVAATAMLGVGLRLEGSRERYSQYLLGGAVGVYYLVGFASYELYALVPFAIAFAFMCAVTVLAFVLAERQRLPSLAVIGASGGLATPFLVNTGSADVPGLVLYTTLLLAGAGGLQFLRGWRSLLLVLGFGGLAVMGLAVAAVSAPPDVLEVAITSVGVLAAWALFGALPLFRAQLRGTDPESWPDPPLPEALGRALDESRMARAMLRVGVVAATFFAVLELGDLYDVERSTFGVLYALAAGVYIVLARGTMRTPAAFTAAAEAASVFVVLAIALFFFDYRVMLPLATAAAAMHLAHDRWRLGGVGLLAHFVFAQLLILVVGRLEVLGITGGSPFGVREIAALGAIALAFTSSFVFRSSSAKQVYRIGAHVAFMAWLATQFGPMERGQELISLSWGIYGIVLLLLSMRLGERGVQLAGLATLGIVALKLLVVDMAQVDVIWRILLFMGFGGAFLGLSYLINRRPESG